LWLPQAVLNKRLGREIISKAKANKMFMPNINYYDSLRSCKGLLAIPLPNLRYPFRLIHSYLQIVWLTMLNSENIKNNVFMAELV
jgi:hypothetical protein